jgi:hypothetical protein
MKIAIEYGFLKYLVLNIASLGILEIGPTT